MSLQITNIEELKNTKVQITKEKVLYQDTLLGLENAIKETDITWNGNESDDFREKTLMIVDKLRNTFDFIKKHFKVVKIISGIVLIVMGILMIFVL